MVFTSIGDLSSNLRLQNLNAALNFRANRLGIELASGKSQDVARKYPGSMNRLGSLTKSVEMLGTYRISAAELATQGKVLQTSLESLRSISSDVGVQLMIETGPKTSGTISAHASAALAGFRSAITALNTTLGGRSIFSGTKYHHNSMISADRILDDLQSATATAGSSAQIISIVKSYFDDPGAGFETRAYLGSDTSAGSVQISENETATFSVTARDPALRNTLSALATSALMTRHNANLDQATKNEVLAKSGNLIMSSETDLIDLQSSIGTTQARIDNVQTRNSSRAALLTTAIAKLVQIDPYATATAFQQVQSNLEALYISTAKLSQMSLTHYLS